MAAPINNRQQKRQRAILVDRLLQFLAPGFAGDDAEEGAERTEEGAEFGGILFSKDCHAHDRICSHTSYFAFIVDTPQ
jgi:hypothetical protein